MAWCRDLWCKNKDRRAQWFHQEWERAGTCCKQWYQNCYWFLWWVSYPLLWIILSDIISNLVKIQRNCKEKNRFFFPANGLLGYVFVSEGIKAKHPKITYADLYQVIIFFLTISYSQRTISILIMLISFTVENTWSDRLTTLLKSQWLVVYDRKTMVLWFHL